jgi:hypothetical protein
MSPNPQTLIGIVSLILAVVLGLAALPSFAESQDLPTRIVMTQADCNEINKNDTLRGRSVRDNVATGWNARDAVWDGLQVFTGNKRDVVAWFESGQLGLEGRGGFQNIVNMRNFQYDLLCSCLLATGDNEIIRAVVWHAAPTGRYADREWRALALDSKRPMPERIAAWCYWSFNRTDGTKLASDFLDIFGSDLEPSHIMIAHLRRKFRWDVLRQAGRLSKPEQRSRLSDVCFALIRREYLSVTPEGCGNLVDHCLHWLESSGALKRPAKRREVIARLAAWDQLGDVRSTAMWKRLNPANFDAESAADVRAVALTARLASVSGRTFWLYLSTPAGKTEVKTDGGKGFASEYFKRAFAEPTPDETRGLLHALVETLEGRDALMQMLRGRKVDITVPPKQFALIKQAWINAPEALDFLIVEEEVK